MIIKRFLLQKMVLEHWWLCPIVAVFFWFKPFLSVASELKPFSSDECSAFPEGTFTEQKLWRDCCVQHDLAYWVGGTYKQRVEADQALAECVDSLGQPVIALVMQVGVRIGGSPFWPTAFRWGYGWPYPRFYGALTISERAQVVEEMQKIDEAKTPRDTSKGEQPMGPAETGLLGHWQNEQAGASVGLILKDAGKCELYVSRFPKAASHKDCKYEPYEGLYLLYLVKENGECGVNADFEFTYLPKLGQIGLITGGSELVLRKKS